MDAYLFDVSFSIRSYNLTPQTSTFIIYRSRASPRAHLDQVDFLKYRITRPEIGSNASSTMDLRKQKQSTSSYSWLPV